MENKIFKTKCLGICLVMVLTVFYSCKKDFEIPFQYDGYAILQTESLPDDGVDLYTFYFLPNVNEKLSKDKINYNRQLMDKSITFPLSQSTRYLKYKRELNGRDWDQNEDLILVKVSYSMLVPDWKMYIDIRSKKITIENKDYLVDDYDLGINANSNGKSLAEINNIELIRKIN